MKKFFFFAAAAVVAIASCTNVDLIETPANKVSFQIANYAAPQVKAAGDTLAFGEDHFYSKAFLHANGSASAQPFFGDYETISQVGTEWVPSKDYFWPKAADSYINFVSWYTNRLNPTTITETALQWGASGSAVTIQPADTIMFADEAWRFKDNTDSNEKYKNISGVSEGVPTLFHQALARLSFNLKLKTDQTATKTIWDVTVKTDTLKIQNTGYLNLTNADPNGAPNASQTVAWQAGGVDATSSIVGWTAASGTEQILEQSHAGSSTSYFKELAFTNFAPKDASSQETAYQVYLPERTVMPQALGTTVKFAMTFEIKIYHDANSDGTKDSADPYSTEIVPIAEQNLTALVPTINAWNMNTKDIYNITLDPVGKTVKFDPAVVDWTVVNGAETEIYSAN